MRLNTVMADKHVLKKSACRDFEDFLMFKLRVSVVVFLTTRTLQVPFGKWSTMDISLKHSVLTNNDQVAASG